MENISRRSARFDPFGEVIKPDQVHARTIHGWIASFLAKGGGQTIRLLTTLILARLLTPEDFGLIAIAASAIGVAHIFKDMGLSAATIRARSLTHSQVTSLFWLNVGLGTAMAAACWMLAPFFASWFDDERFVAVVRLLAFDFLIGAAGIQHSSLLRRHLRFTELAWIRVLAVLVGSSAAVLMAWQGMGYWALVASTLVTTAVGLVLYWLACPFRPGLPVRGTKVGGLVTFGGHMMVFSILGFFAQALPNLIIGDVYGTAEAGFYSRAFFLFTLSLSSVLEPLGLVAPAGMARLAEDHDAYARYYIGLVTILAVITMPACFLFVGLPGEISLLLLGGQWGQTGEILRWIGMGVLPYVVCFTSSWLYMSKGNSRRMMLWGVFGYGFLILCFWFNRHGGLQWIGGVYATALWIMVIPCIVMAVHQTGMRSLEVFRVCLRPLLAGLCALFVILLLREQFLEMQVFLRALFCASVGLFIYFMLMLSSRHTRQDLRVAIELVKKSRAGGANAAQS